LVEKLRTKGLVSRLENRNDRRNVDVQITPKGLELLESLNEIDNYYDQKFKTLSAAEINTLNDLLDKLRG